VAAAVSPAYREVDNYVAAAERFHEEACPKKIKIVVCRNWSDCNRFATPFLGTPLAVTIPTGTVTFVTPRALAFRADVAELLRHELSHAVLNVSVTDSNRRVRTRMHGGVAGVGG
jgi:hypothetical protein